MRHLLSLLALLALPGAFAHAEEEPADVRIRVPVPYGATALLPAPPARGEWLRYRAPAEGRAGSLDVAVTHYIHPDGGARVDLVGAVHLGDPAYFEAVQAWLDASDVVLFEGVIREGQTAAEFQGPAPEGEMHPIREMQMKLGGWLGLAFQLEAIRYDRPHFVHADLTAEAMGMLPSGEGVSAGPPPRPPAGDAPDDGPASEGAGPQEPGGAAGGGEENAGSQMDRLAKMVKQMGPMLEAMLAKEGPARTQMKRTLARTLGTVKVDAALGMVLPPAMKEMLLDKRNAVVMERLGEWQPKPGVRTVSVFYGAGHMGDIAARMEALGYRRVGAQWLQAWLVP